MGSHTASTFLTTRPWSVVADAEHGIEALEGRGEQLGVACAPGMRPRIALAPVEGLGLMRHHSILWSEEHGFWTSDTAGEQWWWSANPDQWRWEAETGHIGGLFDNATMRNGDGYRFAHVSGWKSSEVVALEGFGPETPLFLPRTNGVPILVNGYVVGAGVNQAGYDYTTFCWNPHAVQQSITARKWVQQMLAQAETFASTKVLADLVLA